jgi:hypothetical protein
MADQAGKFGRPTSYNDQVLADAYYYVENFEEFDDEVVPTVVGMCRYIRRGKTTVYNWIADEDKSKDDFRDIVSALEESQHLYLVNKGLVGAFNPMITKLMMGKHGYTEKQEIESKVSVEARNFNDFYEE